MSLSSPIFNAKQLSDELLGRSYLLPTEIEVYIRNLVRIVEEQDRAIKKLQEDIFFGP